MKFRSILILPLFTATLALGQTTQPATPLSADAAAALELRATETFNQSDYATALPMLQRLATQLQSQSGQADRLAMVQEQIRVCQKNQPVQLAAVTSVGDASLTTSAVPAVSPTLAMGADRIPHAPLKTGEVLDTTIKELGNFEFDAEHGSPIPSDVQALNGGNIRLRGFMIPMDQAENISKFALVPSLFSCCYGQPPQIQHTIIVDCPKGKAVSYFPDEITVDGKLSVNPRKDDGFIVSIFEIEASSVKPAPK